MIGITEYINEARHLGNGWRKEAEGDIEASILAFDEPSKDYGIDGGKISKLFIRNKKTMKVICNYDRGWDVKPADDIKSFYSKILKKYN